MAKQLYQLLNSNIRTRVLTNLLTLLESLRGSAKVEKKESKQSVSYLKQGLENEEVLAYSWIPGEEIVTDILTKQDSRLEALKDILKKVCFQTCADRG